MLFLLLSDPEGVEFIGLGTDLTSDQLEVTHQVFV